MKETVRKKKSFFQHSVTKRHADPNPFSYFVEKILGKISILKWYSRQVTTHHIIVWQLILLKATEERIFTN